MEIKLIVYRTPVTAGSCYVFYNSIIRGVSPELKAKMAVNKKSTLQTHLEMLRFFVRVFSSRSCDTPECFLSEGYELHDRLSIICILAGNSRSVTLC